MNKFAIVVASFFIGIFLLAGAGLAFYFHYNNMGVRYEANIKREHESIGVVFSNFKQGLDEIVQVPGMAADDISRVFRESLEGRYGANGSQAVFQMITEQNPQIDPSLYKSIQVFIEGKRNELVLANQRLVDQRNYYEIALNTAPSGFFLGLVGFPKADLTKDYLPIRTASALETMKTGIEAEGQSLRRK